MRIWFLIIVCSIGLVNDLHAQTPGCTDPKASNYNSAATVNDGSCLYGATTITPTFKFTPPSTLDEISGMIFWNDKIYCHRDNYDAGPVNNAPFYEIDTTSGAITRTITVTGGINVDWEDIAQDNDYVYIGDFGNNVSGNRQDLKIYRISKTDLASSSTVTPDVIEFQYPEQTNFTAATENTTDFDCEAMIVMNNKIYLFTKQWTTEQTALYEIPNTTGTKHAATLITTFNVNGLITGADNWGSSTIVLTGYTDPNDIFPNSRFMYLLYDFSGNNFFSGNKRKIELNGLRKLESVTFRNNEFIYIGNEKITFVNSQSVESVNLTSYLDSYYLLPISSIDLKTRLVNNAVQANWNILPASDFASGYLQRKAASESTFLNIHILPGASGNYTDQHPPAGQIAYRIKAKDTDGKDTYSKTVSINIPSTASNLQFQQQKLTVNGTGNLEIISMSGNLITSEKVNGHKSINMHLHPKGPYIARFTDASGRSNSLKFIH